MARMSIDDMLGRDPRLIRLAKLCGWSKRETAGALVLDVWPLCYDRKRPSIDIADIDAAACLDGFAEKMVECGLATHANERSIRVAGAKQRIKYLSKKAQAGAKGGRKSGETRRNQREANSKQNASEQPAPPNPIPNASVTPNATASERERAAYTPDDPTQRGALANACWNELRDRRAALAIEFGQPAPLALPVITPGSEPIGFRDLRDRIREEGAAAPQVWTHVLEVLTSEARKTRSLEWLSDKSLGEKAWRRARGLVPTWRAQPTTGEPRKQRIQLASGEEIEVDA